jgi:dCMP deaminase
MRPDLDTYFLRIAEVVATRTTCARRGVGAVTVDAKGHILSTGYNGVPSGESHCNDGHPCAGAYELRGQRTGECRAVHAEANAVMQCVEPEKIHTVYCTLAPCLECTKLLLLTGCKRVVYKEQHHDIKGTLLLKTKGLSVDQWRNV